MMRRRTFIASTVSVLAAPLAASDAVQAQPTEKGHVIGVLRPKFDEIGMGRLPGWLDELGYREGKNVRYERRSIAAGADDRLPDLATELARLPVDVIVTSGTQATRAAMRATTRVPIVMAVADDPVASGLVQTLARPDWCGCSSEYLPVLGGEGWWDLIPIWDPDQTPTPLRRWEPAVPYWASD